MSLSGEWGAVNMVDARNTVNALIFTLCSITSQYAALFQTVKLRNLHIKDFLFVKCRMTAVTLLKHFFAINDFSFLPFTWNFQLFRITWNFQLFRITSRGTFNSSESPKLPKNLCAESSLCGRKAFLHTQCEFEMTSKLKTKQLKQQKFRHKLEHRRRRRGNVPPAWKLSGQIWDISGQI